MQYSSEMAKVRVLRLGDMISSQKGSFMRRFVHAIASISLRLFFRRIETSGVELVPKSGPVIFVLNHPNGLIDPALVFCALPRRVSFLAKSTLFRMPVIGSLMRTVEALPVYRRIDRGEDITQNKQTFEACFDLLRRGRCIALFPEGVSHNSTQLLPIKTGAARIALGALSLKEPERQTTDIQVLKIQPVGLFYTSKTTFRSEALLRFGDFLEAHPVELDENGDVPREKVRELSSQIEAALREVTLNVESEEVLGEIIKAEQLFSSFYESIDIKHSLTETFNLLRRFAEGRSFYRLRSPERIDALRQRIIKYDEELRNIGISPETLSLSSYSKWYVFRLFLLHSILLMLLSPLALIGAITHYPAYLLCDIFAQRYKKHGEDDVVSTAKIIGAIIFMPLTWIIVTALSYIWWGWRAAVLTLPLVIVCGYVAMLSLEVMHDMKGWYKAILVLLRRRGLFVRLLLKRRSLHREIEQLGSSMEDL